MPKLFLAFPESAQNIEVMAHGILMDVDDLPESDTPPSPSSMPPGERFPDWRWQRLIAAEHVVGDGSINAVARTLADDEWLSRCILPCHWFRAGRCEQPGRFQEAYDAAFTLYQQGEAAISTLSNPARQTEAGILNGWTPEALEAKLGMGYSVEVYGIYEALFFDVQTRRGDRTWLRNAVFRPLAAMAGAEKRMRYMRAALHLERRDFESVIGYPNPPVDRRWLAMMPAAYQRLHYQMLREDLFLAALRRLKAPARDLADLRIEWAVTPPPGNEEMQAWLRLLPPRTWKRFTVQAQKIVTERQPSSITPEPEEGSIASLIGLPQRYRDMLKEQLAEVISQAHEQPLSPENPSVAAGPIPPPEVAAKPEGSRRRDTRVLPRQAPRRSDEIEITRNRYTGIRQQLDQWMRVGTDHVRADGTS